MSATIHLRCGDDIRDGLRMGGVAGDFAPWGDPICEGPANGDPDSASFRAARVAFISRHWNVTANEVRRRFDEQDEVLRRTADYERVVLWFEHDLYDQCILVQLLAAAQRGGLDTRGWQLVCVGEFPGINRFIGLGQLRPEQLASLLPKAQPLTSHDLDAAVAAVLAFVAASPEPLIKIRDQRPSGALRWLPAAIERHLQELPWTRDGLGLTERLTLQAIADGATAAIEVFHALVARLDPQPYLGDTMYWARLDALARAPSPAITLVGSFPDQLVALTDFGRDLLAGRADFVRGLGVGEQSVHRFRAGLEQRPEAGAVWRWDEARRIVLAATS